MASNSSSTAFGVTTTTSIPQTSAPTSTSVASVSTTSVPVSSSTIANSSPSAATSTESISTSTLSTFTFSSSSVGPSSTSVIQISTTETRTSSTPSSTQSTSSSTSTTAAETTSASQSLVIITQTPSTVGGSTITTVVTSTAQANQGTTTGTSTSSSSSSTGTVGIPTGSKGTSSSGGLSSGGTIAVAVVVPIVAVALIILAGLFFWRKRKQRKDAEELRRKEVEEYGYNPNNDPTLPAVGGVGSSGGDGPYEMREDGSSGYRGWGTTAVGSSGRKASTTLSGGQSAGGIGMAYSEGTSPTHGPVSDTQSNNPLMDRPLSQEIEPLGAMGPAASNNRSGDINRGPSNASSQYSAAGRSDGSGEGPGAFGGQYYSNQYDTGNPYGAETPYGSPTAGRAEMPAQPIIRDVQARRNTRIENPAHFPQQSAGISQNF